MLIILTLTLQTFIWLDLDFFFQNEKGFLGYTDVSMGTRVAGICTGLGRLDTMTQNPTNAIIHLGHASGGSRSK